MESQLLLHFEAAANWSRAALYARRSAETASTRGAVDEASRGFGHALELLARLPKSAERQAEEARLRMLLGATLMAARGWGAEEVALEYERATSLCETGTDDTRRFPAQWGLWLFRWGRGELPRARELTHTLKQLAAGSADPMVSLQVNHAEWATSFCQGRFAEALSSAEQGWQTCDDTLARAGTLQYGNHHPGVCARAFAGRTLAVEGRTTEAVHAAAQAVSEARRFEHPFTLALALVFGAATHQTLRDASGVVAQAEEAVAISGRYGFPLIGAWATALLGWAAAQQDGGAAGAVERVAHAVAAASATRSGQFRTLYLALLAESQQRSGQPAAALTTLDEAFAWARRCDERGHEAELHRLAGAVRAGSTRDRESAAAAFEAGLRVAEAQGAHLFALRNAIGLARLRIGAGQREDGERLVSRVAALVPDAPAGDRDETSRICGRVEAELPPESDTMRRRRVHG